MIIHHERVFPSSLLGGIYTHLLFVELSFSPPSLPSFFSCPTPFKEIEHEGAATLPSLVCDFSPFPPFPHAFLPFTPTLYTCSFFPIFFLPIYSYFPCTSLFFISSPSN